MNVKCVGSVSQELFDFRCRRRSCLLPEMTSICQSCESILGIFSKMGLYQIVGAFSRKHHYIVCVAFLRVACTRNSALGNFLLFYFTDHQTKRLVWTAKVLPVFTSRRLRLLLSLKNTSHAILSRSWVRRVDICEVPLAYFVVSSCSF